jgi:hypothetical protein
MQVPRCVDGDKARVLDCSRGGETAIASETLRSRPCDCRDHPSSIDPADAIVVGVG